VDSGGVRTRGLRRRLGYILTQWREEILNYFDRRMTIGFAEGKSSRFKVIPRTMRGYRNTENTRLQILITNHPSRYAAAPC